MTLVKWHYFSVNIWSLAFTELSKYMVPRITVFIRLEVLQFDAILKLDVGTKGLVNLLLNLRLMLSEIGCGDKGTSF